MNNLGIEVTIEKPLNVGAYGFKMIFSCGVEFDATIVPEILIKKKSGTVIVKNGVFQNAQAGVVEFTVTDDVFTEPGTYDFQIRQTGTGFVHKTPVVKLGVYPSIEVV
jgi:hypothetical protein